MRESSKRNALLIGIGVGIVFLVIFLLPHFPTATIANSDMILPFSKTKILDISLTGAWQNTEFTHLIDNRFGESLLFILQQYKISSLTDLGCGTGAYIRMIENKNIKTQGFDGNPETKKYDVSGGLCVGPVDITQKRFWDVTDAAMSIEVAEHIPAEYEEAFINNLVNSARHLIFLSWGVPGQGGEGHVNGKLGEDVVKKMNQRGWKRSNDYTQRLQNDAEFEWIKQNVQVFKKDKDSRTLSARGQGSR